MKYLNTALTLAALTLTTQGHAVCGKWTAKQSGALDQRIIDEASGLIASKVKKDMFIWSNDSGGKAELYATGVSGKVERTVALSGFSNSDFEAIANGPCINKKAENCIYVGDIGDGIGWRSTFKIGVFKESDFWTKTSIAPEKVINFSYPKGAENAEGMVVTRDGKITIFSKDGSGITQIYQLTSTGRISHLGEVDLNKILEAARGKGPRITDASLSADEKRVLLLTYGDIAEVSAELLLRPQTRRAWQRGTDYNIIKGPGLPQQETIAYTAGDSSFIVSTESPKGDAPAVLLYSCQSR
ncbi:MAG: hypothetical protein ACLGHN_03810 [Bacteriovoracia bacterium]